MKKVIATLLFAILTLGTMADAMTFNVRRYGAKGNGKHLDTSAIQKAIDACTNAGGGTVIVPEGTYLSATIELKDNVNLHLEKGAVILGTTDYKAYRNLDPFTEGLGIDVGTALIVAVDAKNVSLTGEGTIDGQGAALKERHIKEDKRPEGQRWGMRPFLLRWVRCENITVNDVTLKFAGAWTSHYFCCSNVNIDNVTIRSFGVAHNDGINIDGCTHVRISNCDIVSGDDALCFKTTSSKSPCNDIVVNNMRLKSNQAGIKMGTESMAAFENIKISNCHIYDTKNGGIKLFSVDGANLRNVEISDITMDEVRTPMMFRLGARLSVFRKKEDTRQSIGTFENVTIRNVEAVAADNAQLDPPTGILITGIPDHYITNLTLENIHIRLLGTGTVEDALHKVPEAIEEYPEVKTFGPKIPAYGVWARHVRGLKLKNVTFELKNPDYRSEIICEDGEMEIYKNNTDEQATMSPDGKVQFLPIIGADGILRYKVTHDGIEMIKPSRLGLKIHGKEIGTDVKCVNIERASVNDAYELKAGKKLSTRDRCEQSVYSFLDGNSNRFDLIVRAYNDGIAFRYHLPGDANNCEIDTINAELTEFNVPTDGKAWIHPYDWNERHKPSYEQYSHNGVAINSLPGHDRGWAFPLLFEQSNGKWMMVTEAVLDGTYPATHVDNSGENGCYRIRFPEADEAVINDDPRPVSSYPWLTPWRVVVTGDALNDIFSTQMVAHLNAPSKIEDESWIKPGRAAWSWWYDGKSASSYDAQIKYVDFCKKMGWEYSLIDAGWQTMDKDGMEGVVDYANKNGVGIWLWYHSGAGRGDETPLQHRLMSDPELRRKEMARISKLGIKGIKVDFFDTDKQRIVALYPQILKDAADYHLLVDLHGASLPRGLERTYPNLMTTEAIRGAETLGRQERCEKAAEHNATVPFTRNVVGSMDYTPVTFSNKIRQGVPAIRRTSMAHQLALAIVFESGFQCFADRAEAYNALPKLPFELLKDVPSVWNESHLLAGYPSDFVVVARKNGDKWYIGGINGKNETRNVSFKLPKECEGKRFTIITDGNDIDSFGYIDAVSGDTPVSVTMLGNGGFAAVIE